MSHVYAKPGESLQQIGGTAPTGWVQMQGQRPSPYHVAQADGTWQDSIVDAMRERIKAERDRRQQEGGFLVAGQHWFHSDNSSRIQQMRLDKRADELLAAGGSEEDPIVVGGIPVQWKLMDGTFVPMTAGLAKQIAEAAEAQEALLFKAAETHIAAMEQSPDPASYDYSGGWPMAFWERGE